MARKKVVTAEPLEPEVFEPEVVSAVQEEAEDSLFDDLEAPDSAIRRLDGIPPLDSDLTVDEKKEFIALLNRFMPLEERALQLCALARLKDTKRAPVGLRAIQEILVLTGLRGDKATESSPIFQLPPDAKVSVSITKVVK